LIGDAAVGSWLGLVMRFREMSRVDDKFDPGRDGELDLRALGRSLWRKKWWALLPALVVALLAGVAVNLLSPQYKS
jgi:LPS O-antigen subunit length determinant protein (WzzB/FepE family)